MFTLLDKNKTNNPSLGTEPFFYHGNSAKKNYCFVHQYGCLVAWLKPSLLVLVYRLNRKEHHYLKVNKIIYLVMADSGIFIPVVCMKINTIPISKYCINILKNNQKIKRNPIMQIWKCHLKLKNSLINLTIPKDLCQTWSLLLLPEKINYLLQIKITEVKQNIPLVFSKKQYNVNFMPLKKI